MKTKRTPEERKVARSKAARRWAEAHPEKVKEADRRWRAAHPEECANKKVRERYGESADKYLKEWIWPKTVF